MILFKLYKPIRESDLERFGCANTQEFCTWFAGDIQRTHGAKVSVLPWGDSVAIKAEEDQQAQVAEALDVRGLSSMMSYE